MRLSEHWPKLNPNSVGIEYDRVKGPAFGWLTSGKDTLKDYQHFKVGRDGLGYSFTDDVALCLL